MRDAAYTGVHGLRDDAIVTLLHDTGLRRAEVAQVEVDMFDLGDALLRIPAAIQKDYPNYNSPSPATFELDPSGDPRTDRTLRTYLD